MGIRFSILLACLSLSCSLLVTNAAAAENSISLDDKDSGDEYDFTTRRLEEKFQSTFFKDLPQIVYHNRFPDLKFNFPNKSYRTYSPISLPMSFLSHHFKFFKESYLVASDYIPFDYYLSMYEQYYVDDIHLISFTPYDSININLRNLSQGSYFLKINIPLHKPDSKSNNGRQ
jgi:hypothetical protein